MLSRPSTADKHVLPAGDRLLLLAADRRARKRLGIRHRRREPVRLGDILPLVVELILRRRATRRPAA